jgi:hypothetical protein
MKKKITLFLRDMLLLVIFLLLVSVAARKSVKFLTAHKESMIHELDHDLLQQSETVQEMCKQLKRMFGGRMEQKDQKEIDHIGKEIMELEEIYKKNSNALILLGPIGTVSIILKERQVKADLLRVIKKLIVFMNRYVSVQKQYTQEVPTIDEGIAILQKMLS